MHATVTFKKGSTEVHVYKAYNQEPTTSVTRALGAAQSGGIHVDHDFDPHVFVMAFAQRCRDKSPPDGILLPFGKWEAIAPKKTIYRYVFVTDGTQLHVTFSHVFWDIDTDKWNESLLYEGTASTFKDWWAQECSK